MKRRPVTADLASSLRHGDTFRHGTLTLSAAILTDTVWICRLASESCGTPPMHEVKLSAEVELVRAFATAQDAPTGEVPDPLLRGAS
jgi:hypothetical protein